MYLPSMHLTPKRPVKPDEGRFDKAVDGMTTCGRCRSAIVEKRRWRSLEGGFVDDQFECAGCGYIWWVENVTGAGALHVARPRFPSLIAATKVEA